MRLFYDIIADKRDKKALSKEDISDFLQSYLDGTLKDYQMSAMLMAIFFNSLSSEELETPHAHPPRRLPDSQACRRCRQPP